MLQLRAAVFYLGIAIAAAIVSTSLIIVRIFLPLKSRYWLAMRWNRFAIWWLDQTCGLSFRISGLEHLPDGNQAVIVFCKHQSAWETIALPPLLPPLALVFKRELLWIPFFGWGLACLEPIVLDRSARQQALRVLRAQGRDRLARGRWILLFPEGTRVAPGATGRYNSGGAMLAVESGTPVLPVAHNAGVFWTRNSFAKRPGVIDLMIGPLIATTGRSARDVMRDAESWIESTTNSLPGVRPE